MKAFDDKPWRKDTKIVIGFDIGTTQAAVSFAYLYKGAPQTLYRVIQWPGQNAQDGESKIPSLVWYDKRGQARAFGAEAKDPSVQEKGVEEGWSLAEHWKLHLHPSTMKSEFSIPIKPLPPGVSAENIYADFIGYLYSQTRIYFYDRILDGEAVWKANKASIEFVIAHPNGWGPKEQVLIRRAVVAANLVSSKEEALKKVKFVTEAEASVHFVVQNADLKNKLEPGTEIVVCDAGGSTVDTTLYVIQKVEPTLKLKEKRASDCIQAGAVFVNESAAEYFSTIFREAQIEDHKTYVDEAVESFEEGAKRFFKETSLDQHISVGGRRFSNDELKVRRGKMTLQGSQVQQFFDPWVKKIIDSVKTQILGHSPECLMLVGGFGESEYLYDTLKLALASRRIEVTVANEPGAKAVADGSVMWFVKRSVRARATRFAYGTEISIPTLTYPNLHRKVVHSLNGPKFDGAWSQIVAKNFVAEQSEEKTFDYVWLLASPDPENLCSFKCQIFAYDSYLEDKPMFVLDESGDVNAGFHEACVIHGDLSGAKDQLTLRSGPHGPYWMLPFSVALIFGDTEIRASMMWKENGIPQRSVESIISDSFI